MNPRYNISLECFAQSVLCSLRTHAVWTPSSILCPSCLQIHNARGRKPRCVQLCLGVLIPAVLLLVLRLLYLLRLSPQVRGTVQLTVIAMASHFGFVQLPLLPPLFPAIFIEDFDSRLCRLNCNVLGETRSQSCKPKSHMGAISQRKIIYNKSRQLIRG